MIVFIHGAGHDHSVWNLPARYLARHGYQVLAPDLPAHGCSAGPALTRVEDMASWLLDRLDREGIAQATLAGHSMGSLVALEAAARAPERIEGLALIGTAVPMPVAPALLDAARDDPPRAHAMINQWSFSPDALLGRGAVPGMLAPVTNLRLMGRQGPGVLHADLAACNAYARGLDAAARIACPTLQVCGKRDQMTPARNLGALNDALSRDAARLMIHAIDGCGHAIMAEKPEALTDALMQWRSSF
ncbi:MAG: alpha/beta hydrolase [Rhodocyclaceae bacterium]|nr:alpha/beta hydrolase [Rhodocyclaceae bacterium]